jgi:hypothetical protein
MDPWTSITLLNNSQQNPRGQASGSIPSIHGSTLLLLLLLLLHEFSPNKKSCAFEMKKVLKTNYPKL